MPGHAHAARAANRPGGRCEAGRFRQSPRLAYAVAFLDQLGRAPVDLLAGKIVYVEVGHDLVAPLAGRQRERAVDTLRGTVRRPRSSRPWTSSRRPGTEVPIPDGTDSGVGGRGRAGRAPGLDDGRPPLLDRRQQVVLTHFGPPTRSRAGWPSTLAWKMSGYWVAEWLPQMDRLVTDVTRDARLGRHLGDGPVVVEAGHGGELPGGTRPLGPCPALWAAIKQLVLAGLPTTSTRDVAVGAGGQSLALDAEDGPVGFQEVPAFHALAPGPRPDQHGDLGVAEGLIRVGTREDARNRGKAQSSSSITTPFRAPMAAGTSKRRKATGCCGPSIKPLATLKSRL